MTTTNDRAVDVLDFVATQQIDPLAAPHVEGLAVKCGLHAFEKRLIAEDFR